MFILHGHGTGILRQAIRSHFAAPGHPPRPLRRDSNDGGDGVTVLGTRSPVVVTVERQRPAIGKTVRVKAVALQQPS